jgi:DNA-binding HxlR family transcriptional regulator
LVAAYFNVTMKPDIHNPDCPSRGVLDRISDKWTALIVLVLRGGPLRFSDLRIRVGGVAPKVLTETLRRLERDGLLTRTAHAEVPPRVEYELTALGHSLAEPITAITARAEEHMRQITRDASATTAVRRDRRRSVGKRLALPTAG